MYGDTKKINLKLIYYMVCVIYKHSQRVYSKIETEIKADFFFNSHYIVSTNCHFITLHVVVVKQCKCCGNSQQPNYTDDITQLFMRNEFKFSRHGSGIERCGRIKNMLRIKPSPHIQSDCERGVATLETQRT